MDCEHVTVTGKSCRHERLGTQTSYESLADKMCQLGFTHMIEICLNKFVKDTYFTTNHNDL